MRMPSLLRDEGSRSDVVVTRAMPLVVVNEDCRIRTFYPAREFQTAGKVVRHEGS